MTGYVLEEKKKERVDKSRQLSESSDETWEIQTPDSPEIVKKRRPFPKSKIAIYFIYLAVDYLNTFLNINFDHDDRDHVRILILEGLLVIYVCFSFYSLF